MTIPQQIIERLKTARMPRIAVLNKVDRVEEKEKLLALTRTCRSC